MVRTKVQTFLNSQTKKKKKSEQAHKQATEWKTICITELKFSHRCGCEYLLHFPLCLAASERVCIYMYVDLSAWDHTVCVSIYVKLILKGECEN